MHLSSLPAPVCLAAQVSAGAAAKVRSGPLRSRDAPALPQGRKRFKLYQQLLAFAFAVVQAAGQEFYLKPYVPEWSVTWFVASLAILSGGAMVLVKVLAHCCHPRVRGLPGCNRSLPHLLS